MRYLKINRSILKNDLKRYRWVLIIYFFVLVFLSPALVRRQEVLLLHKLLLSVLPVMLGMLFFKYMKNEHEADIYNALPVKKEVMYNTHVIAGLIVLVTPLFLNLVLFLIIDIQIVGGFISSIMLGYLVYLVTILVGMFTRRFILEGILTYFILILPVLFFELVNYSISRIFVFGCPGGITDFQNLEYISPLLRIAKITEFSFMGLLEVLVYFVVGIIVYYLGMRLYTGKQAVTKMPGIKFGIKIILISLFAFLIGIACHSAGGNFYLATAGFAVGAVLGYYISCKVINSNLQTKTVIRELAIIILIVFIIAGFFYLDIPGYESKIPESGEIECVTIIVDGLNNRDMETIDISASKLNKKERIMVLHRLIIRKKEELIKTRRPDTSVYLAYELKNGKLIERHYEVDYYLLQQQLDSLNW